MNTLQQGATLQGGRYRIQGVLGQGGFGITYIAEQIGLGRKVAIKEFFMKEWCERDASTSRVTLGTAGSSDTVSRFREKFMKEARNISRLNHPNIVRIHDVFEENGTAYYVMDYAEGGSLADLVKRKGCLSEADATRYILQVADALQYIHAQNMAHLDVKPANILLNERGEAILIDFGLSKQYDATSGGQTSTTPVGISEGYAPMEQYRQGGVSEFSPETDIYSLGATFFKLLTGKTPPTASDIFEDGVPVQELKSRGVSQAAITIITQAMEPRRKQRMKDVKVFIQGLKGDALNSLPAYEGNSTSLTDNSDDEESTKIMTSYREGWAYQNDDSDDNEEAGVNSSAQQSEGQSLATPYSSSAPQANENTQIPHTVPEKYNEVKIILIIAAAVVLLLIVVMCNSFGGNNSRDEGVAVCDSDSICVFDSMACDTACVDWGPVCTDAEAVPVGDAVTEEDAAPTEVDGVTYKFEDGRALVYSGSVDSDGLPHGNGTGRYLAKEYCYSFTFTGTFVHGFMSKGEAKYNSGAIYKGTFDRDGNLTEGTFRNGVGYYFVGTFRNGSFYNGIWYDCDGNVEKRYVDGECYVEHQNNDICE